MNPEQKEFRAKFKHIVWLKGRIKAAEAYVKSVTRYDKNGSHTKAIKEAIDKLNNVKDQYNVSLEGKSYAQWKQESAELSKVLAKERRILNSQNKLQSKLKAMEKISIEVKQETPIEKTIFNVGNLVISGQYLVMVCSGNPGGEESFCGIVIKTFPIAVNHELLVEGSYSRAWVKANYKQFHGTVVLKSSR